jgi:hypothetical protein
MVRCATNVASRKRCVKGRARRVKSPRGLTLPFWHGTDYGRLSGQRRRDKALSRAIQKRSSSDGVLEDGERRKEKRHRRHFTRAFKSWIRTVCSESLKPRVRVPQLIVD